MSQASRPVEVDKNPTIRPRSVLLCHHDSEIDRSFLARWLASWTTLCGIIEVRDAHASLWSRALRERKRSGWLGLLDVLLFRFYYYLAHARRDRSWEAAMLAHELPALPPLPADLPILRVIQPNSRQVHEQLIEWQPDFAIARIKVLLKSEIFSLPKYGMYALHPGICPQYRNAHGCFWALARQDAENVGATLLRIDQGVDTGPVYSYLRVPFDRRESHIVIQQRAVVENLPRVRATLEKICLGEATPISNRHAPSAVWGQPRLTSYLRGRRRQ